MSSLISGSRGDDVADVLSDAPLSFERSDHRGVTGPSGDVVSILHFRVRTASVPTVDLEETLEIVGVALAI